MIFRALFLFFAGLLSGHAAEPSIGPEALAEQLPNTFLKLSARQPVHVTFVGDSVFMDQGDEASSASAFLKELSAAFYYTGGVHEVYDPKHLTVTSPKITFEQLPIDRPNCFNLAQHTSTLGLLNEPDLLVIFTGAADADQDVSLPVYLAQMQSIASTAKSANTEVVILGPRLLEWDKGDQPINLRTRAYANLLAWWCKREDIPYSDPNTSLLPPSVLFPPRAEPKIIWAALIKEIQDAKELRGSVSLPWRALTGVGKQLFHDLGSKEPVAKRIQVEVAAVAADKLTMHLTNITKTTIDGMIVSSIDSKAGVIGQAFAIDPEGVKAIELPLSSQSTTFRGMLPVSSINIDNRHVQLSDMMVSIADVGVEWLDRSKHNITDRSTLPVHCRVYPYAQGLRKIPYTLRAGEASTKGTLVFSNRRPAEIDWAIALPTDPDERHFQSDIELMLGEGEKAIMVRRRVEAVRQFHLNKRIELRSLTEGAARPAYEASANVVKPSLTFLAEASEGDLSLHFDFKNMALPSTIGRPALELGLAIDARPYDQRQTIGHVGVLQVTASASDDPAMVSPAAALSHFGDGHARRPLPSGIQARLSTRPNGDRRLTVQMTRKYFYRHPWQLENANSQLGLRATLTIAQEDSTPAVYALHAASAHPNNAEALTILELAETKVTKRWCAKFWELRDN